MALNPVALAISLENDWLVPDGGAFPSSPVQSADKFASAVATWFSAASAGPFPCATAMARKSQLAGQAASALQAMAPPVAGALLGAAVASYMTGQSFGAGVASAPAAASLATVAFAAVFSDLESTSAVRARRMAAAAYAVALSTIVVFPPVVSPPVPVI